MKMKKKAFLRALIGAPIGLTISVVLTILVSVTIGDGKFYPVQPELTTLCGGELTAVALQTAASLLYGAVWAAASVIWETDWSLLRQTLTHVLVDGRLAHAEGLGAGAHRRARLENEPRRGGHPPLNFLLHALPLPSVLRLCAPGGG